jgi:uncharacterized protein involved in exopolysaccharide biosynthesis
LPEACSTLTCHEPVFEDLLTQGSNNLKEIMSNRQISNIPPSPSIGVGDILYILFRHKWKILIICVVAIIGFFVTNYFTKKLYAWEAKVFVRSVVRGGEPNGAG